MSTPRTDHVAILLSDGQAPVAGGVSFSNHRATDLASAELYTPLANRNGCRPPCGSGATRNTNDRP